VIAFEILSGLKFVIPLLTILRIVILFCLSQRFRKYLVNFLPTSVHFALDLKIKRSTALFLIGCSSSLTIVMALVASSIDELIVSASFIFIAFCKLMSSVVPLLSSQVCLVPCWMWMCMCV